jgi:hypothetical protein
VFSRQQKAKEIEKIKSERKEMNGDLDDKKGGGKKKRDKETKRKSYK